MLVHLSEEVGHTYATIMKDKSAALRSVIKVMQIYFYFFSHFYFLYFVNSYSYFLRIDYLFSDFLIISLHCAIFIIDRVSLC